MGNACMSKIKGNNQGGQENREDGGQNNQE